MASRRRKLGLPEKIFVLKCYYEQHGEDLIVKDLFEKQFDVQTTEDIVKTIQRIVSRYNSEVILL